MSWNIISRDSFDLTGYSVLPFGRFNQAMPFVSDFINSTAVESDLVEWNVSNTGALQRAIIKLSGIKLEMRTAKKDGTVLDKPVPVYDGNAVRKACAKLGIALESVARNNAEGKLTREFVSLKKVA
jgi:hypothetical protein